MNVDWSAIRHVVFDMDGTIYLGNEIFDHTLPCFATLDALGIGYTFITNNCSRSRAAYRHHLRELGIDVDVQTIMTSAQATSSYLRRRLRDVKRLFVLGTEGLVEDLRADGFAVVEEEPDAVVVGFDLGLSYERLCRTAYLIRTGLPYLATHPDFVCPTNQPTVLPDCGAVCKLLEAATGREPDAVAGKPNPSMIQAVLDAHHLRPNEAAMIGDRIYTDIAMAKAAGAVSVLTLTGEACRADVLAADTDRRPDQVIEHLGELAGLLQAAR